MILGMRFLPGFDCKKGSAEAAVAANAPQVVHVAEVPGEAGAPDESHFLKTIGWVSAALGAVALGLIVGRELRQRYKFNRRTPYDLYAHSGDELPDVDFGVGI
jgi:hypothetical protein